MTPERIRDILEAKQMSQVDFAEKIGVPLRTLENWIANPDADCYRKPNAAAKEFLKHIERCKDF